MEKFLAQSIVKTLAYFDIFSTPLTLSDLYTYLWNPGQRISFSEFFQNLSVLQDHTMIESQGGYFFLRGRSENIAQRERRVWYMEKKMKRAQKAARLLRFIPFVKAVFVCNQIQVGVTEKSDIDVLIVAKSGRLYIARFLVTAILSLFRLRRNRKKITDRICLSFYVTDVALDFSCFQIGEDDVYLAYWLATLLPVYDSGSIRKEIIKNNPWAVQALPHAFENKESPIFFQVPDQKISLICKKIFEKFFSNKLGDWFERRTKKIQLKHMSEADAGEKGEHSHVVISDSVLKFHENDRREKFRTQWQERYHSLGI